MPEAERKRKNQDKAESHASKQVKVAKAAKPKPARVQVDPSTVTANDRPPQTGSVFNIWYLKWSGGDKEDGAFGQTKSEGRCNIAKDSGYTRADKVAGSYFCFYFARGLCTNGKDCEYLHRLPQVTDMFPANVDCFGRKKFADYREDMGGVGSFLRQNRTLYVGRIHLSDNIEEKVARHFSEWGDIERIRVLNNRGVAFVTFRNEANAQFAREAMAHQSLDNDEVLNVRWAHEDPNPLAKVREQKRLEEQATEAIKRLLPEYGNSSAPRSKPSEIIVEEVDEDEPEEKNEEQKLLPAPSAPKSILSGTTLSDLTGLTNPLTREKVPTKTLIGDYEDSEDDD